MGQIKNIKLHIVTDIKTVMTEEEDSNHDPTDWLHRAEVLKEKFCGFGECDPPSKAANHLPDSMQALISVSGGWHIQKDHCNVFGLNLFESGGFLDKFMIIAGGDEELMEEWRDEHDTPNCAQEDWECFGAMSEYDYLFVCVDPASEYF